MFGVKTVTPSKPTIRNDGAPDPTYRLPAPPPHDKGPVDDLSDFEKRTASIEVRKDRMAEAMVSLVERVTTAEDVCPEVIALLPDIVKTVVDLGRPDWLLK